MQMFIQSKSNIAMDEAVQSGKKNAKRIGIAEGENLYDHDYDLSKTVRKSAPPHNDTFDRILISQAIQSSLQCNFVYLNKIKMQKSKVILMHQNNFTFLWNYSIIEERRRGKW